MTENAGLAFVAAFVLVVLGLLSDVIGAVWFHATERPTVTYIILTLAAAALIVGFIWQVTGL